jgi:hypothetical protein
MLVPGGVMSYNKKVERRQDPGPMHCLATVKRWDGPAWGPEGGFDVCFEYFQHTFVLTRDEALFLRNQLNKQLD